MAKKFLAFLLAACLCLSSSGMENVWAAQMSDSSSDSENVVKRTEDLLWNEVSLTEEETKRVLAAKNESDQEDGVLYSESQRVNSAIYTDDWDRYSTNYIYNQLSAQLREVWDELDEICLKYLTTETDMPTISAGGAKAYAIDQVTSSSISTSVLNNLGLLFKYCNPQYYFLNDYVYYGTSGTGAKRTNILAIGVYTQFASGSSRSKATKSVKDQLTSWEKTLSAYTSDYEIALAAHDLINNKVVYDDDIYDDGYDEDNRYSQSAYSALCTDLTVCAGYTLAYEMIMNAMGIDCIGVTSDEHAWNKVILEDNWYNVDCTWDDTGGKYFYFARNDVNIKGDGYHNPTGMWVYYLPTCTLDTYSGYDAVGELPNISSLTKTPQVHVTKGTKGYNVIIESDTPDAEIYYTTDGTEPSCAKTRCELYYTGFTVAEGTVVRAIAVADQRLNSQETKIQVTAASIDETANDTKKGTDTQQHGSDNNLQTPGESQISDDETGTQVPGNSNETPQQTYQITYYLDGGTNSEENPSSYDSTQTVALKAPMKTGYTFEGWYILSDYTAEVDEIIQGTAGNITLFAKWVPHQYKILFKGNGSTSGSMAKLSCKYGKSYQLTANKFKRTGYTFIGWNTKANGKGTFYKNKAGIKNLTTESDKKIVLYAQWKKK